MKFFKQDFSSDKTADSGAIKPCMILRKVNEEIAANKKGLNPTVKRGSQDFEALKFQKGGQYFNQPYEKVLEVGSNIFKYQGGIINYLKREAIQQNISLVSNIKKYHTNTGYFVNLYAAYLLIWKEFIKTGIIDKDVAFETFLDDFANEKHKLTPYRGSGRNGKPIESKAIMSEYFRSCGIAAALDQIIICNAGFKGLYMCATLALLSKHYGEDRIFKKSSILVSKGYYQDLALPLPLWQSQLKVIDKLSAKCLQELLQNPNHTIAAIFISSVSNPEGEVLSEEELYEISQVILHYNFHNPDNPIFVISDEVYKWSTLNENIDTTSIASINIANLGSMHDYTLTITSASKTFGYASSRVGIACSGNYKLLKEISWAMKELSCSSVSQVTEITTVAAFALTPKAWVDNNNKYYVQRLIETKDYIASINQFFQSSALSIIEPQGGWFVTLKFNRQFLGNSINSSIELQRYFLKYDNGNPNSGICVLPGIVFGFENQVSHKKEPYFLLRCTLAVKKEELEIFFTKIKSALLKLQTMSQEELAHLVSGEVQPNQGLKSKL